MEPINLPDDTPLLITVMDEKAVETLSLGERLAGGLQDILRGRFTEVRSAEALSAHLDKVLGEA